MMQINRWRGVARFTLVVMIASMQPWEALAALPGDTDVSTTETNTQSVIPATTYGQLRQSAIEAEKEALYAQKLANQKMSAFLAKLKALRTAVKDRGYLPLLVPDTTVDADSDRTNLSTDDQDTTHGDVNMFSTLEAEHVFPCNEILGISFPMWPGQPYKTSDGEMFFSYDAAKEHVLKSAVYNAPVTVEDTGATYVSSDYDTYNTCINVKTISDKLGFPKKFTNVVAGHDPQHWEPLLSSYYTSLQEYKQIATAWYDAEGRVSDICAQLILEAEAKDPTLAGIGFDAYGFWISAKLRYFYLLGNKGSLLPSDTSLFDHQRFQKIFQDISTGTVDTAGYRNSMTQMLLSYDGQKSLLHLDRAFGFAAAYATSLKTQAKLTDRLAKAVAAAQAGNSLDTQTAVVDPFSGTDLNSWSSTMFGGMTATSDSTVEAPVVDPNVVDPAMAKLSSRLLEALYMVSIPVLDRTKQEGMTPAWVFVTGYAKPLDDYFFALQDATQSAVVMNGGFDIYDPASGWHKMQVNWQKPYKTSSYSTYKAYDVSPFNGSYIYGNYSELYDVKAMPASERRFADSYLSSNPLVSVLTEASKAKLKYVDYNSDVLPAEFFRKFKNSFGVTAMDMLTQHDTFLKGCTGEMCYMPEDFQQMYKWKNFGHEFALVTADRVKSKKSAGDPVNILAKNIRNFSSVAFLFHPIGIGFGSCSVYETLSAPYDTLGYSCVDYVMPMLMLYSPLQTTPSVSLMHQVWERLKGWMSDLVMPQAFAADEYTEIQKSAVVDGYVGVALAVAAYVVSLWNGDGSGINGKSSSGGSKSVEQVQMEADAAEKAKQDLVNKIMTTEVSGIANGKSAFNQQYLPVGYQGANCADFDGCMAEAHGIVAISKQHKVDLIGVGNEGLAIYYTNSDAYKVALRTYYNNELDGIYKKIESLPQYTEMYQAAKLKATASGNLLDPETVFEKHLCPTGETNCSGVKNDFMAAYVKTDALSGGEAVQVDPNNLSSGGVYPQMDPINTYYFLSKSPGDKAYSEAYTAYMADRIVNQRTAAISLVAQSMNLIPGSSNSYNPTTVPGVTAPMTIVASDVLEEDGKNEIAKTMKGTPSGTGTLYWNAFKSLFTSWFDN